MFRVSALQPNTAGWLMLARLDFMPINSDRQEGWRWPLAPSVIARTTAGWSPAAGRPFICLVLEVGEVLAQAGVGAIFGEDLLEVFTSHRPFALAQVRQAPLDEGTVAQLSWS